MDEYTLARAFSDPDDAARWLNYHFDNFVSEKDVTTLAKAGVTHVRVPLPHWILGDVLPGEPWIPGDRWKYFVRLCKWCRRVGIEVWPDLHTAPGSQNGFDNSGQTMSGVGCKRWSENATHVDRTLQVLRDIAAQILEDDIQDVVTGFGLLNEPFKDCGEKVYDRFIDEGLGVIRGALGEETAVYVSDMFLAPNFNDRQWKWLGLNNATAKRYNNTYLDSHYYHVFAEYPRELSPRQHIAFVCQNEYRDATSCCYEDSPANTKPAHGVKRMVGEFSAACDTLPVAKLDDIMTGIATNFTMPELHRELSPARRQFLQHFVEAQMVAYEAADVGTTGAWFYWTLKMEGGAFAEWDYLRGLKERWIPIIPPRNTTSQSLYGTCYDIIFRTDDSPGILFEFPDPDDVPNMFQGPVIDDDVVVTHGDSLLHGGGRNPIQPIHHPETSIFRFILYVTIVCFFGAVVRTFWKKRRKYSEYEPIEGSEPPSISLHANL